MEDPVFKETNFTRSPYSFPSSSPSTPPPGMIKPLPPSARFSLLFENAAFDNDYVVTDEPAFWKEVINSTYNGDGRAAQDSWGASLQKNVGDYSSDTDALTEKCLSNGSHGKLDFIGSSYCSHKKNARTVEDTGLEVQTRKHSSDDKTVLDPDASRTVKANSTMNELEYVSTSDHAGETKNGSCFGHETSGSDADKLMEERECKKLPLSSRNLVVLLHHALRHGLKFSLRGMALGDALTQPVKSTGFFLTSSKLTNLFNYEERNSWSPKEKHANKNKKTLSPQPPFIQKELLMNEKGVSSESDMSINRSLMVDNLDECNMHQQVLSDKSTQTVKTDDSIAKATQLTQVYCRGLEMDSSEDLAAQHPSALSMDKLTFSARSLGQNQEDEVHVNGNFSCRPQEFGNENRSADYTTNMDKKSPMLLQLESISPRDFPTSCCCSMDSFAPLGCKQKAMQSSPPLHQNQSVSEYEEHIMLAKSNMAFWPNSESHRCFSQHVPHFPHRWTQTSQPNEWPKSSIPCHSCHGQFHYSSSVGQFQNDIRNRQPSLCWSPDHYETFQNPSEVYHRPASSVYQYSSNCGGQPSNIRPKKLLWVSEEEAEIIRLIRVSQDINRCSSSDDTSRQHSPIPSTKPGNEIPEDTNLGDSRGAPQFSSGFSSSSAEHFCVKSTEDGTLSTCDIDIKSTSGGGFREESVSLKALQTCHDQMTLQKRAASCIQLYWRKCLKRKEEDSKERKRLEALKFVSEMPPGHDCLMQMAITAIRSGGLVRWYFSMHMAAKVIQRAWRKTSKRMHEDLSALQSVPRGMKKLYEFTLKRHKSKGHTVPSYEIFSKSMERLQAIIEGSRIRRRLKSRRLQTIVKEIKEIRLLVQEISNEPTSESFPNLLPQLSIQLQQKMMQLQTALSGPQDAARVLLRRCPATPLVIGSSKTQLDSSPLKSPAIITAGNSGNISVKSSVENFSSSQRKKRQPTLESTDIDFRARGSTGSHVLVPDVDLKVPLSSSENVSSQENLGKQLAVKKERNEKVKDRNIEERKEKFPRQPHIAVSPMIVNTRSSSKNNVVRKTEQPVQLWQKDPILVQDISSEEPENLAAQFSDYEDVSQNQDIPKHPFLRRKSKAMPPQKLDWSKVKPMVRSRLEPELKTRLFKPNFRGAASFRKKRNLCDIKSRLFSYERTVDQEATGLAKSSEFKHDGENTEATQRKLLRDYDSKEGEFSLNKSSNMESFRQPSLRYFQNNQSGKGDSVKILEPGAQHNFPVVSLENMEKTHEEQSYFPPAPSYEEKLLNRGYAENKQADKPVVEMASELEKMFDTVIRRKDGETNSLASFFVSNQEDSIVPRVQPSSCLFKLTRLEMSRVHKLLNKEGCAGRLQHKCLSFVSIRD